MTTATEIEQEALFETDTEDINLNFVNQKQNLGVPKNPLHWKAHKLQLLLARLEKQMNNNPAQFNSANYLNTLDKFTEICEQINGRKSIDARGNDAPEVGEAGHGGTTQAMGEGVTASMGNGISADNPFAG